jgi:hypothetical protein
LEGNGAGKSGEKGWEQRIVRRGRSSATVSRGVSELWKAKVNRDDFLMGSCRLYGVDILLKALGFWPACGYSELPKLEVYNLLFVPATID